MVIARDVLLEVLRTEGVTHLFGNPGSTELPLIDALAEAPDLHYVLGLQEATVVAMADGYAQATGRPAFVNLHTSAGLGTSKFAPFRFWCRPEATLIELRRASSRG